jgi:tetratricopeptide (TPR) repeat protein
VGEQYSDSAIVGNRLESGSYADQNVRSPKKNTTCSRARGLLHRLFAAIGGKRADSCCRVARLQANDSAGAAKILEQVTHHDPDNRRAWRNLGLAYQNLKDLDRALDAYHHALDVDPAVPTPLFNVGVVYALKQDKDRAPVWLAKAKATHKLDMTQIEVTPELASLKSDARFSALLPTRQDFDNPFVEPVKIIREWDGESGNDQFGWIARNIGDVDGDGVPDVVISAPTSSVGGDKAGRIYVYSTKSGKYG